jgi:hypothetical protein
VISPSIHRELARQKQADLLREADAARLAAKVKVKRNDVPTILTFAQPVAMLQALSFLGRGGRRPQPA